MGKPLFFLYPGGGNIIAGHSAPRHLQVLTSPAGVVVSASDETDRVAKKQKAKFPPYIASSSLESW